MIAIDTNVLVRVLVDDPGAAQQNQLARASVAREKRVFIPQPVQIETLWVLSRSYGFDRQALLDVLDELQRNEAFELEHAELFAAALSLFRIEKLDFADAVILSISRGHGLTLLSFDRKLARRKGAHLLE